MTAPLVLAEFGDPDALLAAARRARDAGLRGLDAHTPFAVDGLPDALGLPPNRLRLLMLLAGLAAAALTYALCWYSAVIAYRFDEGGRPAHSWQTFLIVSFEVGILAAAVAGTAGFFVTAGLPRLHDRVFGVHDFGRASQDRFFLAVGDPDTDPARLAALLDGLGPLSVRAVAP